MTPRGLCPHCHEPTKTDEWGSVYCPSCRVDWGLPNERTPWVDLLFWFCIMILLALAVVGLWSVLAAVIPWTVEIWP